MLEVKLTQLSNGLKILTAPLKNTRAVSILFLFNVGSRFEAQNLSGLSHFLEHMFFKGTKKRPSTIDISTELDNVGASYNAFTAGEVTGYFVQVSSEHFGLGLDVLTDMIFNSKFDSQEIEKEKGVIVEEINMRSDEPQIKVEDVIKNLLYPDQPLGRKVTGEKETVVKFKREDFITYKNTYYEPGNMIVVVAGDTNNNDWLKQIEEKMNQFSGQKAPKPEKVTETQNSPQIKLSYKETDQAHFILGFRSIKRTDPRRPGLKVLTNLMGQMMSSRLFIEVRERRGLCYYISSEMVDYQDTGFWAVSAGVDINRIDEALKAVLAEIEKIKTIPLSSEELKKGQENLKGHLYISLEESMNVAEFLAEQQIFWNKIKDPDEIVKEYQSVTAAQIKDLANEIFKPENLNLAVVGPFKDEEKFKKIIEEF